MTVEPSAYVEKGTVLVLDMNQVFFAFERKEEDIVVFCHPEEIDQIRDLVARAEEFHA